MSPSEMLYSTKIYGKYSVTFSSSFQGHHIFSTRRDAKHLTLAKNNTTQSFRNDLNGLKAQQISKLSGISHRSRQPKRLISQQVSGRQCLLCLKQPKKSDFTDVCQIVAGILVLLGRIAVLRRLSRCGLLLPTE